MQGGVAELVCTHQLGTGETPVVETIAKLYAVLVYL